MKKMDARESMRQYLMNFVSVTSASGAKSALDERVLANIENILNGMFGSRKQVNQVVIE